MPSYELPEGVETMLVRVCAGCNEPIRSTSGHIHKRFSPAQQIKVVRLSDLDAIRSQERQRVREALRRPVSSDAILKAYQQGGWPKVFEVRIFQVLDSLEDGDE